MDVNSIGESLSHNLGLDCWGISQIFYNLAGGSYLATIMTYDTFLSQVASGKISNEDAYKLICEDNFDYEIKYYDLTMYFESLGRTIISTACEDYFMKHYGDAEMPEDDWEALMNYECSRHTEWADEENL